VRTFIGLCVAGAVGLAIVTLVVMRPGREAAAPTAFVASDSEFSRTQIVGRVIDDRGPIEGARVRLKGRPETTRTDSDGRFSLLAPQIAGATVTAWKDGFFIGGAAADGQPLVLKLEPLPRVDFADYHWVDPSPDPAEQHNCGNCHAEIYREWQASGHADAARNRRFMNLYGGTDWHGREGVGWSLLADHPAGLGVCASCHAPSIAFDDPAIDDLRLVNGVAAQGVHCDFCHKIQDVTDDKSLGIAHGRFGLKLLRPAEEQIFFGPLDDVDRGEDVYSPLQSESRYCASCHEGILFGVHVYSTYSEWLASPARREGRSCQSCHMTPTGALTNIAPGAGGIPRDPHTLASHTFLPGGREAMLKRCLKVSAAFENDGQHVKGVVEIVAHDVGHRVPTGFIDRHLILVVEPQDADGRLLPFDNNNLLPTAAGQDLADLPGRLFARLLVDTHGQSPAPFWRPTEEPTDTRLTPEQPSLTHFQFPAATHQIRIRLLYRRFWDEVTQSKSWPDDTIVIYDRMYDTRR
jgi:hypothetical protein